MGLADGNSQQGSMEEAALKLAVSEQVGSWPYAKEQEG